MCIAEYQVGLGEIVLLEGGGGAQSSMNINVIVSLLRFSTPGFIFFFIYSVMT